MFNFVNDQKDGSSDMRSSLILCQKLRSCHFFHSFRIFNVKKYQLYLKELMHSHISTSPRHEPSSHSDPHGPHH
jgi:hypothetical protein